MQNCAVRNIDFPITRLHVLQSPGFSPERSKQAMTFQCQCQNHRQKSNQQTTTRRYDFSLCIAGDDGDNDTIVGGSDGGGGDSGSGG